MPDQTVEDIAENSRLSPECCGNFHTQLRESSQTKWAIRGKSTTI